MAYETIPSKIRGVSHNEPRTGMARQKIIRRYVRPGVAIRAVLEPENQFGDNAVALWLEPERGRSYHLGYIGHDLAETVAPAMRAGSIVTVAVTSVTGGKANKAYGVNIMVRIYPSSASFAAQEKPVKAATKHGCLWYIGLIVVVLVVLFVCVAIVGAL